MESSWSVLVELKARAWLMELKKASNHPYLFDGAEIKSNVTDEVLRGIVMNSGKMALRSLAEHGKVLRTRRDMAVSLRCERTS